ncbi:chloride channel protein [Methylovirgula sp. 4M-Z18]|uniref:chloride channel protein n=1 Tax=Methylovirgula sp. 4M-Z18 TaxID=2293567 RepID=UPI000E2F205A|nr:chloride channel protein [Methylovirgula sp. 4M-Z18]RFB79477.1 chloride channel protein [Methylovirgula sp. 4M-Z18]
MSSQSAPDAFPTVAPSEELGGRFTREADWLRHQLVRLRLFIRNHELGLTLLAAVIGLCAGVIVSIVTGITHFMHFALFNARSFTGVSGMPGISPIATVGGPVLGGICAGVSIKLYQKWRDRVPVDPIEANALHGGRMSLAESAALVGQNIISNGFGMSVGLEAGYTQIGSGVASWLGRYLGIRRADLRTLVGCGAAGAIAAAFGAPLAGSAYAFELVMGVYTIATLAPIAVAAFTGNLIAQILGTQGFIVAISVPDIDLADYPFALILGVICAGIGVLVMQLVTYFERAARQPWLPAEVRPVVGSALVGLLGLVSPQALSAGHGALHLLGHTEQIWWALLIVLVCKVLASAISIGAGFRGGLFFASLFIGGLVGKLFALLLMALGYSSGHAVSLFVAVAMGSMAAAVIGAPLTMILLALESTGSLNISGIVMLGVLASSVTARATFGYSFATWRFHLRGESIRSAHDVGWIRSLTVDKLMRHDPLTVRHDMRLDQFRGRFPLGTERVVVAVDDSGSYAGLIDVAAAHNPEYDSAGDAIVVIDLAEHPHEMLTPGMNAKEAALEFDRLETDMLVVVDDLDTHLVIGLVSEKHLLRRYSAELDRHRREALGEV